jgi:hypothetical protein
MYYSARQAAQNVRRYLLGDVSGNDLFLDRRVLLGDLSGKDLVLDRRDLLGDLRFLRRSDKLGVFGNVRGLLLGLLDRYF